MQSTSLSELYRSAFSNKLQVKTLAQGGQLKSDLWAPELIIYEAGFKLIVCLFTFPLSRARGAPAAGFGFAS